MGGAMEAQWGAMDWSGGPDLGGCTLSTLGCYFGTCFFPTWRWHFFMRPHRTLPYHRMPLESRYCTPAKAEPQ